MISLEALANRVIKDIEDLKAAHEIPEREPTTTKWKLIPVYHPHAMKRRFNTSSPAWQAFVELVKWRDEYVHPKAIVIDVQRGKKASEGTWEGTSVLKVSEIPTHIRDQFPALNAPRSYGNAKIPTSPYDVNLADAQRAREIVNKMTARLDEIVGGRLTNTRLLEEVDRAVAIHPDGKIQDDLEITRGLGFREIPGRPGPA